MTILFLLFLLVAEAGLSPSPAAAADAQSVNQPVGDSTYSIASTQYTYRWGTEIPAWHRRELSLETFLPVGVFVTNLVQQRRFGQNEIGGDAHYWAELWGESYAHIHASMAPTALTMPRISLGGELYEVRGNWEVAGWGEWRGYSEADVYVLGPQIGYYLEQWYLRLRTSFVGREGTWVVMQSAAARRYLGDPDSFVEAQVGYGQNVELADLRPVRTLEVSRSYFVSARMRHFFGAHLGASMSATVSQTRNRHVGLSGGLLVRW